MLVGATPTYADGADWATVEGIYAESCAVCHGDDGSGAMPGIPDLTDPDGHLSKSDTDLLRSIINGVDYPGLATPMPPSELDEDTAKAVLKYLRATAQGGN